MCLSGALQCQRKIGCRGVRCLAGNPTGKPTCDLLQQPAVAIRVGKRCERTVAGVVGCRTAEAIVRALWLELSAWRCGVKYLGDFDTAGDDRVTGRCNLRNDKVEIADRAGFGAGELGAELDRTPRSGQSELDDSESVIK